MQPAPKLNHKRRGFALLDAEALRAVSSKGGKAAHEEGSAHEFTPEEAAIAGRLGGVATQRKRKEESGHGNQ
jgi:uncharacterized protein